MVDNTHWGVQVPSAEALSNFNPPREQPHGCLSHGLQFVTLALCKHQDHLIAKYSQVSVWHGHIVSIRHSCSTIGQGAGTWVVCRIDVHPHLRHIPAKPILKSPAEGPSF